MNRIAFVHGNSDVIAGQEIILLNIVKEIKKRLFYPIVILPKEGEFDRLLRKNNVPVKIIPLNRLKRKNFLPFLHTIYKLFYFVKREKIKLMHTSGLFPNQYSSIVAKLANIHCVCHLHSTIYGKKEVYNSFLRLSDKIIAVSNGVKSKMLSVGMPHNLIEVIYNGIDINNYKVDEKLVGRIRDELKLPFNSKVVTQVGQLIERKGILCFLEIVKIVSRKDPNVLFLLVGDDSYNPGYRKEVESLIKKMEISKNVKIMGFRKEIPEIIFLTDVILLCSEIEGLPTVLIEALYLGRPIVATNIPGTDEVVENKRSGFLFPVNAFHIMAEKILEILKDEGLRIKLSFEGKKRFFDLFSLDSQIDMIEKIYRELL